MRVLLQKVKQLFKKVMQSNLKDYLKGKLSIGQYEEGLRELFNSPHRRTKVLENAAIATHAELLALAAMCNVSAYSMFTEYGVAKENLTLLEIQNLEYIFVSIAPDKAKAQQYIERKEAAMAA